jgi:ribose-phosphate pyrophosphokinase
MMEHGAKSVRALCTHGVLSGPAYERIANSSLSELVITDSMPLREGADTAKIKVLPVHDLFAKTLTCLVEERSISSELIV